jgi:hypothetical protein
MKNNTPVTCALSCAQPRSNMKTYRIITPDNEYVDVQAHSIQPGDAGLIVFLDITGKEPLRILNSLPGTLVELVKEK